MRILSLALMGVLFAGTTAFASNRYQCYPKDQSGDLATLWLVINGNRATLEGHKVSLDATYKPRLNKDYVRFEGDTGWLNPDGYQIDLLVHKILLKGATKGSMKVMARGEGFFNDFYNCYLKP